MWDFSGLRLISQKIIPPLKTNIDKRPPSSFFLWFIGLYSALFGLASQRYENRRDIIENRISVVISQAPKSLELIPDIQKENLPRPINFFNPLSVISSLILSEVPHPEIVDDLKRIIEINKNLYGLNLEGINLTGTDLSKSDLRDANLNGSDLRDANLSGSTLGNASLRQANLQRVNFKKTYLSLADFSESDLRGAQFEQSDLDLANFSETNISEADFRNSSGKHVNFKGANAEKALGLKKSDTVVNGR